MSERNAITAAPDSISSRANRRHDRDGIRLEIDAPGRCPCGLIIPTCCCLIMGEAPRGLQSPAQHLKGSSATGQIFKAGKALSIAALARFNLPCCWEALAVGDARAHCYEVRPHHPVGRTNRAEPQRRRGFDGMSTAQAHQRELLERSEWSAGPDRYPTIPKACPSRCDRDPPQHLDFTMWVRFFSGPKAGDVA